MIPKGLGLHASIAVKGWRDDEVEIPDPELLTLPNDRLATGKTASVQKS